MGTTAKASLIYNNCTPSLSICSDTSGLHGLAITPPLAGLGVEVRGLVRRVDATDVVRAAGASDVIVADLRDLDAIEAAARGNEGILPGATLHT